MKAIDLHCDALSVQRDRLLSGEKWDMASNSRHIDLNKMAQGDYLLQCFAIFYFAGNGEAPLKSALEQADLFYRLMEENSDRIVPVRRWSDIAAAQAQGKMCGMLTVEDGGCCMGSLGALRQLYRLGARIMTLTWNFENELAHPNSVTMGSKSGCHAETVRGLKPLGFDFVAEMERIGILVDVSHLSDAGFWDVARIAKKPFIASHSSARTLSGHVRNLTDEMLRAIADHGGIVGINYDPPFLDTPDLDSDCVSTVDLMVKHIRHIQRVAGLDIIALGSDFDGIHGNMELQDCSMVQRLAIGLEKAGFTNGEVERIFNGNALRLFKEVF